MTYDRFELEKMIEKGCQVPGCDHADHPHHETLFIHARCHLQAGVELSYTQGNGYLLAACGTCKKEIGRFILGHNLPSQ